MQSNSYFELKEQPMPSKPYFSIAYSDLEISFNDELLDFLDDKKSLEGSLD
jgi:hypothetical protein